MAKITEGAFRSWHDTETIHAAEYVQEREMIRVAVNDNDGRIREMESSVNGILLGAGQLKKITDDEGGVKLSITSTTGDILAELVELGKGMHTFYAVSGVKNLPPTGISIRGFAHFTDNHNGWVYATDYDNNVFTNYYSAGKLDWTGWNRLVAHTDTQEELWTGAYYMSDTQTVTPTKKLTACRNGWILIWSDYNPGDGVGNYDFAYSYVPKFIATKHPGAGHLFNVPRTPDGMIVKYLNISDTKIEGNAGNELGDDNDVVLRYVLEW